MIHVYQKGYGIMVLVAVFVGYLIADLVTRIITGEASYFAIHPESVLCGGSLAASFAYAAVKLIERWNPPHVDIDEISRQRIVGYHDDSLFFVPVRFWPYLIFLGSLVWALVVLENPPQAAPQ